MHFPLIIAVLAFLALLLLPLLDRAASSENDATNLRTYVIRLARWTQE